MWLEYLQKLLLEIYNKVAILIINFLISIPDIFMKFIIFLLLVTLGIIIGKVISFIARVIFSSLWNIDESFQKLNLSDTFFGYPPSKYITNLVKWYIYLYFLIYSLISVDINIVWAYNVLNLVYLAIIIFSAGLLISMFVYKIVERIDNKKIISTIVRYVFVYAFLVIALKTVGLNVTVLETSLNVFIISLAISFGIFLGAHIFSQYKDIILK